MCGLFGGISNFLSSREVELIQDLGAVSVLRGRYGAGIVIVPCHRDAKIRALRTLFPSPDVLYSADFENFTKKRVGVIMGHTRHPTAGDLTIESIHPHECGDILGMHNGTLTEVAGVKVGKNENDSKLLFTYLNNRGVDETFGNVKGAYACTWINKAEKTLNFLRNGERSLYLSAVSGAESTIYWASEQAFIECVLSRDCLPTESVKCFSLPPGKLLTFDIYNKDTVILKGMRSIQKTEKPAEGPVEKPTQVVPQVPQVVPHCSTEHTSPHNGTPAMALLPAPALDLKTYINNFDHEDTPIIL